MQKSTLKAAALIALCSLSLSGCSTMQGAGSEEARAQDSRTFAAKSASLPFDALTNSAAVTDRWFGTLNGSGYRIEVPKNWNGKLVMWAHGYIGTGPDLVVSNPRIRRFLIDNGYAWAGSSYSKNYYDVRAGIEDTNALALAFTRIAADNKRTLAAPTKIYLIGQSMGGHITAAAIEDEAVATARNKVRYNAALAMCPVAGDTELFDYFVAYQLAAQQLAGLPAAAFPVTDWAAIMPAVRDALFTDFAVATTAQGDKLKAIVKNLTGGERPIFNEGFANTTLQKVVWGAFGTDGSINGILNKNVTDTSKLVYRFDAGATPTAVENAFNNGILRVKAAEDANRPRKDGMRWIPKVNGDFRIPMVSLHTLGDMYVPFRMQQVYRQRVDAKGNGQWLVQRAIRAPSHCDFSVAEQVSAFEAMINWEQSGVKPEGDDVMTPAVVGSAGYGCKFTNNTSGQDDAATLATVRKSLPACQ